MSKTTSFCFHYVGGGEGERFHFLISFSTKNVVSLKGENNKSHYQIKFLHFAKSLLKLLITIFKKSQPNKIYSSLLLANLKNFIFCTSNLQHQTINITPMYSHNAYSTKFLSTNNTIYQMKILP